MLSYVSPAISKLSPESKRAPAPPLPSIAFCAERQKLLEAFGAAAKELAVIQDQQITAVIDGDEDFNRFDLLLHMAQEKKEHAKYAYLLHVEQHGC
jgi:hypothetical protein